MYPSLAKSILVTYNIRTPKEKNRALTLRSESKSYQIGRKLFYTTL